MSNFNTETEGVDIIVYDSMYSSLSKNTQTILSKLVHTDKPELTVKMANVSKQSGTRDCGLFAIAYITHIANRLDPSLGIFNQAQMRDHVI